MMINVILMPRFSGLCNLFRTISLVISNLSLTISCKDLNHIIQKVNGFSEKVKVTMSLNNLYTILVFYVDMNYGKKLETEKYFIGDREVLQGKSNEFECW